MQSRWSAFDSWGNRVAILLAIYTAMTTLFSWLSSLTQWSDTENWAGAILIGFLFASAGIFVGAVALIGWRYFKPLPQQETEPPDAMPDSVENAEPDALRQAGFRDLNHLRDWLSEKYDSNMTIMDARVASLLQMLEIDEARTNATLETIFSVVWGVCARDAYKWMADGAPKIPESVNAKDHESIKEYISSCEVFFTRMKQLKIFRNIMTNAEKEVDRRLESQPPEAFTPALRKQEIAKQQAKWLVEHFRGNVRGLDDNIRETIPALMDKLNDLRAAMQKRG